MAFAGNNPVNLACVPLPNAYVDLVSHFNPLYAQCVFGQSSEHLAYFAYVRQIEEQERLAQERVAQERLAQEQLAQEQLQREMEQKNHEERIAKQLAIEELERYRDEAFLVPSEQLSPLTPINFTHKRTFEDFAIPESPEPRPEKKQRLFQDPTRDFIIHLIEQSEYDIFALLGSYFVFLLVGFLFSIFLFFFRSLNDG